MRADAEKAAAKRVGSDANATGTDAEPKKPSKPPPCPECEGRRLCEQRRLCEKLRARSKEDKVGIGAAGVMPSGVTLRKRRGKGIRYLPADIRTYEG